MIRQTRLHSFFNRATATNKKAITVGRHVVSTTTTINPAMATTLISNLSTTCKTITPADKNYIFKHGSTFSSENNNKNRYYNKYNLTTMRLFSGTSSSAEAKDTDEAVNISAVEEPKIDEAHLEKHEFQAETRKLLDIVINSVYTDKEVFLREIVSNASDALEKLRHAQVAGEGITESDLSLEIKLTTDKDKGTITIEDTGIGMSKDELINNLGCIARSGSKNFVAEMKNEKDVDATGIIGQFGVGFYSAFMVADNVTVYSKSNAADDNMGNVWRSDGTGSYDIAQVDDVRRGSKIVLHLKESCKEFANKDRIKTIIQKYSNFVNFPIVVDGETINTVQAIWSENPNSIDEEKYSSFYKFIAGAFDDPLYKLHFNTDVPLDLRCLLYFPSFHGEKFGMTRLEPGVNLYSRKVLIEAKCDRILPDWMRFIKGVVDSEDLPLSISREKAQDTQLVKRIQRVLVRKILSFLADRARKEPETFKKKFFPEFGFFLKEGICQDYENQSKIAPLLYFESSKLEPGELTSLDEYISRCDPEQNDIYYLCAPNRELAEASPYFEAFKENNKEVFFVYNAIDDFVMTNLSNYHGRTFKTVEATGLDLEVDSNKDADKENEESNVNKMTLTEDQQKELCEWLRSTFDSKLNDVKVTKRLANSPAIITDHESGALRRMVSMVEQHNTGSKSHFPKQHLEINPKHPIIVQLHSIHKENQDLAQLVAEQVLDNALIAAGVMEDGRSMLPRLNKILGKALGV